jgi:omega-amidase
MALNEHSKLRITTVQFAIAWEQSEVNRAVLEKKLSEHLTANSTDLVVLPEMFTTGFTMNALSMAEDMEGETILWMVEQAKKHAITLTGSVIIKENNRFFNRLLWVDAQGNIVYYDKRHLFTMANEHHHFSSGEKRSIFELNGWRILPLICYDLRFPVWSRNVALDGSKSIYSPYHMLIYVANWPAPRRQAWQTLLKARAAENQSFVVGVNRVGIDGKNHAYTGDTLLVDPLGSPIYHASKGKEEIATHTIEARQLLNLRKTFPILDDADSFRFDF